MSPDVRAARSRSERLYARLLDLYPPRFRQDYGPLMLQLFRDQERATRAAGSGWARWQLWWRVGTELAPTAAAEHWTEWKGTIMHEKTTDFNPGSRRVMAMLLASVLLAGGLIGKVVVFELGGSTTLALAVLLSTHLLAGLVMDRAIEARGTAFGLMALLTGASLLPLLWVPDGRAWLRENPLVSGIILIVIAGWFQTGRARWPLYVAAVILAASQILSSLI